MASQKTKTILLATTGGLLAVLIFGSITFFILKVRAQMAKARELAELKEYNPVEYFVLHTPMTLSEDNLRNALVGRWQLIGAKSFTTGEFTVLLSPQNFLKTFTLTNWAIVTYDSGSNVLYSAGGRYTLQGDAYTETIDEATGMMTKHLGKHPKFRIRVDGDKYYQMGAGKNPSIEEMWQRIEP
jgi:hypothetical protein